MVDEGCQDLGYLKKMFSFIWNSMISVLTWYCPLKIRRLKIFLTVSRQRNLRNSVLLHYGDRHTENMISLIRQSLLTSCASLRAIGWRHCRVIERASSASGSMTSTGYVFNGHPLVLSKLKSRTTIKSEKKEATMIRVPTHRQPTHPGEMLLEEFLNPMDVTQRQLADAIHVPYQRINEIINGKRGVTPATALRLARFFGISADYWMNLQQRWDLYEAHQVEGKLLNTIKPLKPVVVSRSSSASHV